MSRTRLAALALLVIAGAGALAAGCARQSGARADAREVRLTRDEAYKGRPLFSPDGKSVAFAQRLGTGDGILGVHVMPVGGGAAERISPDTLGLTPLRWASDGKGIFCVNLERKRLYRLGLDRSVRFVEAAEPLSRFADVTGDGASYLLIAFHKDNYDVMLRRAGRPAELLAATPDWEQDAVFGPGPDQATTLSTPTFQSSQSTITLRSLSTGDAKPLPLPEGQKYAPAWSPDGRTLAYAVSSNGQLDVWLYDATTARATPAIQDPQDAGGPAWSADGKWLAFARATRSSRLFVGEPGDPGRRQLTHGPANDYGPFPSPDGRWIAFQRRSPPGTAGADTPALCVMPAAGGDVVQLDLGGLSLPGKGSELAWSWDSEHIAFSAREATTSLDVHRIRRDGTGLLRVTIEAGDEIDPRWSPDGRRIAYTRVGGGETRVAVVPSTGGASRVISDEGVVSEGSAWSPDGRELAYLSLRREGAYDLWVIPAALDRPKRLVLSHTTLPWPHRWSEDGRHIILMRGQGADWYATEFDPASGEERRIATETMLPSGLGSYLKFLPDGEAHRRLLCPAGAVMADGEQKVDLYMVRAGGLLKSRLISSEGRGLHWFARTGWVASF
jgi:TolB protein